MIDAADNSTHNSAACKTTALKNCHAYGRAVTARANGHWTINGHAVYKRKWKRQRLVGV